MEERWDSLSEELKRHYTAVARTVAQGHSVDTLKAQVDERGQAQVLDQTRLQQQLQDMRLTDQARTRAHEQANARAAAQPALIQAALRVILDHDEATIGRVMTHTTPVSADMFTGDSFGSDACQAMLTHVKNGESPVVAPGTLLG